MSIRILDIMKEIILFHDKIHYDPNIDARKDPVSNSSVSLLEVDFTTHDY